MPAGRQRPCVLVFAGSDPSGGAGIQADVQAVAAQGAHALTVVTALTVQDNDRVYAVHPVGPELVIEQARALTARIPVAAVKLGIVGSRANAQAIADFIRALQHRQPGLPVVLDPVLGSGHGDALAVENAVQAIAPLLEVATLITPNLPEAGLLCAHTESLLRQARHLLQYVCADVLIKGGHGNGELVSNLWLGRSQTGNWRKEWQWPRLPGEFHGSGCTLASAIAAQLALGRGMDHALDTAQAYCQQALASAFAIAGGQLIPARI
ncbi:hydroxymethylpyrimidine/phosphomethylpyrimidine kinase [Undibacterium sp.]|jgi:hydroxymethylpyrimidine/phosphomethylpyrimidine kinase|uniref:bifunctional hydroxymethylpyrimidine kinase/phosphomethylpyrimidine kinase n=1 Tax=Undibacterium sp. TaxID=1914977 RepID=UPI002CE1B36F|nr:hydroxymethylpyrimidine/phosphomethylpyrimidine kinase [Undibacterium sp.]HTD03334.1 hydroxymethylpyrimidine/phosphomethylpyrimidine kinase [Undibacterium sp.]